MAKELRVGMIGAGLMGKAHSLAMAALPIYFGSQPVQLTREVVAEIDDDLAETARERFGFNRASSDWKAVVDDPGVDVIDIVVPSNLHEAIATRAFAAGKAVICEKPLGLDLAQARHLRDAALEHRALNQVGFNWRFAPAVQLAKRLIDEGRLGSILSFRGVWLADSGMAAGAEDNWRFSAAVAGSGSLGDLGAHVIDWARLLVGEISEVNAISRTYERASGRRIDVDDDTEFLIEFDGGAHGSIRVSRFSPGRKNFCGFEIYGEKGSLVFDWERMNEIRFYDGGDPADRVGFRTILTGPDTPSAEHFWPVAGYGIGYLESKLLQFADFVEALETGTEPATTFHDGVVVAQVIEAVQRSVLTRRWTSVGIDSDSN